MKNLGCFITWKNDGIFVGILIPRFPCKPILLHGKISSLVSENPFVILLPGISARED